MNLKLNVVLSYAAAEPCDMLAQIKAAQTAGQFISSEQLSVVPDFQLTYVEAEEDIGSRIIFNANGVFEFTYRAIAQVSREPVQLEILKTTPVASLPSEVVKYLMPSRYCDPDHFERFVGKEFAEFEGGACIAAMSKWVADNLAYTPGSSQSDTTAADSFEARRGVCRDFAHVLISMARSAAIPSRMVSAYAPYVQPQDFHAVVEVYLDGAWHLVDPTGMSAAENLVVIGVGRDAADISFLTSFGEVEFRNLTVSVTPVS